MNCPNQTITNPFATNPQKKKSRKPKRKKEYIEKKNNIFIIIKKYKIKKNEPL